MSDGEFAAAHDVLMVGGGAAGLRAAIAIAETNPLLDVAVISKVYPMRSHTVSAEGGAAGVIAEDDTLEEHIYDTISGSDWLGDQDAIEYFVEQAPTRAAAARALGLPVEPAAGRADRRAGVRRHEEQAHLVRRRQDRLPHAARAVPDLAQVQRGDALRRGLRHQAARRRRPRARRRRDRAAHRQDPHHRREGRHPRAPAAAARSSRSPRTPTSTPATAWRWPTAPVRR